MRAVVLAYHNVGCEGIEALLREQASACPSRLLHAPIPIQGLPPTQGRTPTRSDLPWKQA